MHFSKTYSEILLSLPPELRENAVQYKQLKRLINKIVYELCSLGLSPELLHELLDGKDIENVHVLYELNQELGRIEPRLRIVSEHSSSSKIEDVPPEDSPIPPPTESPRQNLLWVIQKKIPCNSNDPPLYLPDEIVIPLASDSAFFQLLTTTLNAVSDHLTTVRAEFVDALTILARDIGDTARPVSQVSTSFRPYSVVTSHPGALRSPSTTTANKSDLYSWREIFKLYIESEVFTSVHERDHGERSVEEVEKRLKLFAERVTDRGLGDERQLRLEKSRDALKSFLELNLLILNVKKFSFANSEATRKILKKHTKRTALALPSAESTTDRNTQLILSALLDSSATALPKILVQVVGERLLPVIPHLDDYSCLICTSIAFKPIRLSCGHLFCVRCLVKMQKRGQGDCPMCRAKTVLCANRTNVDWGLLNFMQDWFPIESREKLKQNEREAAEEQMRELGIDMSAGCIIC